MSSLLAFLLYAICFGLALWLLYRFHVTWYWHVLSVVAALAVGLYPAPESWRGPWLDALVGCLFVFFFFWGAGEILFHTVVHHRTPQHT